MSDFDRNAAAAQYGAPLTRAEAAVVDEGLRAYMLRIYNYMVLGLAITGFAALGIYMLSVTTDPALAVAKVRNIMLTRTVDWRSITDISFSGGDPEPSR